MRTTAVDGINYARLGLHVLPIHAVHEGTCSCGKSKCDRPGKHPATQRGFYDATTDEQKIRAWFNQNPGLNVAIRTGAVSRIIVLDVDPRNGGKESLEFLQRDYGPLPTTATCRTGGGGLHIYFGHPRIPVRSRQGILPGVDVKGEGGYVLAPPSVHFSGAQYRWIRSPDTFPPASLQGPLLQFFQLSTTAVSSPAQQKTRSLSAVEKSGAEEGTRNTDLARLVGRWITQEYSEAEILEKALAWSRQCRPPLPGAEAKRVAHSILTRSASRRSPERKATILMRRMGLPATARCVVYGLIGFRLELGKHGQRGKDGMSLVAPYRVIRRFSLVSLKSILPALKRLESVGLIQTRQVQVKNRDYSITVVTFLNGLAEIIRGAEKQEQS